MKPTSFLATVTLKALRDLVDAKDKELRASLTSEYVAEYRQTGIKSRDVLLDGEKVAAVTLSIPKKSPPAIIDEAKVAAYLVEHDPDAIEVIHQPPIVRPKADYADALLERLVFRDGEAYDPDTGERVEGISQPHTPEPKAYSIRYEDGGRDRLLEAWRTGALTALDEVPQLEGGDA